MKISGIYAIVNKINGHRYIGSAVNISNRWNVHACELRKGNHHSIVLQRAYDKHGENSFSYVVLECCAPDELIKKEQEYLDRFLPEYNVNMVAGNMSGYRHSEETKQKIRKSSIGRLHTDEERKKISDAQKGCKNHMFGKKHSDDEKLKISESCKGKPGYWTGKSHSEASNKKRSDAMKAYRASLKINNAD